MENSQNASQGKRQAGRRAGVGQVAATIFFALFAIGKKNTWEKDGVTVSMAQVVIGAILGSVIVIGLLVALAKFAAS